MNPDTMTVTELADWCAMDEGWSYGYHMKSQYPLYRRYMDGAMQKDHPFPLTLDGAAKAMPEGMRFERRNCDIMHRWEWWAWKPNPDKTGRPWTLAMYDPVLDTGDPIADLYRLGVKARLAAKGAT
jgi:hypothetical protein